MCVKASRDEHPGWLELVNDRCGNLLECAKKDVAIGATREGDIDGAIDRVPTPYFCSGARTWIERPLVSRHVEDLRRVPKDLLSAVSVVDVPVNDKDTFSYSRERGRGDGHIIE